MATARCYTKSGSVEKYEEDEWEGVILKSTKLEKYDYGVTVPDSNGNYSVEGSDKFDVTNIGIPSTIPDNSTYWLATRYGGKACYFEFTEKKGTGYDLYCRVLYINDNMNGSNIGDFNPNYSVFGDKFGINIINTYNAKITYGEIYKNHKDGYFGGTFYSNKEDTGSDTIEATVKLKSIITGGQVNNGTVQFEFFLIPNGSNPANYKNEPSIDGEISPTSEVIDNRIYNKGNPWGIHKGNYAMENPNTGADRAEHCNLEIGLRCNFHFNCTGLNKDNLNAWALGDLSGIYTKVKNRYSTTIPYLKLNIIWDMNN